MSTELPFSCRNLLELSKRLNQPITIFDTETTGLQPPIAVVEIACMTVLNHLDDPHVLLYQSLIRPDCPFGNKAQEVTGISYRMVSDAESWKKRYAAHFHDITKTHMMIGYNVQYDINVVVGQNSRAGLNTTFAHSACVYDLYKKVTGQTSGKLAVVAEHLGIPAVGAYHRAMADTIMTAAVLDKLIDIYGIDKVIYLMFETKPLTPKEIAKIASKARPPNVQTIANSYNTTVSHVWKDISTAVDERLTDGLCFVPSERLQAMHDLIDSAPDTLQNEKKLKAWKDFFTLRAFNADYAEIRIALLSKGKAWVSLKPTP